MINWLVVIIGVGICNILNVCVCVFVLKQSWQNYRVAKVQAMNVAKLV